MPRELWRKPASPVYLNNCVVTPCRRRTFGAVKVKWANVLPVVLMLAFALTRWPGLFPDTWSSFSAAYALMFCAGVYFPRVLVWWLPIGTLLVSDVLLNIFHYKVEPVSRYMLANYIMYAALIWLGRRFSSKDSIAKLVGGGLLGALVFFLVTNTVAWLRDPAYTKDWDGFWQALTTGVPGWPPPWTFLRNTLISGGLFTGLFAGAMKLSEAAESAREKEAPEPVEEEEEAEPEETKA